MFIVGNLITAMAGVVNLLISLFTWLIIFRAIISWVNPDPFNPIVQFLQRTTEPFLEPIRRFLPSLAIDVSPIIAFLLLQFLQRFLVKTLLDIGVRLS